MQTQKEQMIAYNARYTHICNYNYKYIEMNTKQNMG